MGKYFGSRSSRARRARRAWGNLIRGHRRPMRGLWRRINRRRR